MDALIDSLMVSPPDTKDQTLRKQYQINSLERKKIISSGQLKTEHADRLLSHLASFVVQADPKPKEIYHRQLYDYFTQFNGYEGLELKYVDETNQFIQLLGLVSDEIFDSYANQVVKFASFWELVDFNFTLVQRIPRLYVQVWADLLFTVGELETRRNNREMNVPKISKLQPEHIVTALGYLLEVSKDEPAVIDSLRKSCVSLISYRDLKVQNKVKDVLSKI